MTGIRRNLFDKVSGLLDQFPIVVVLGARQVGKTTLVKQVRPDWLYFDCEKPSVFERIKYDPEFFFEQYNQNIILDEAQALPVLFDVLRGVIDGKRGQKGRFLITGSSSPELLRHVSESLAGRVAIVELDTLKANELFSKPLSQFYSLFNSMLTKESVDAFARGRHDHLLDRDQICRAWYRGGYPEPVLANSDNYHCHWMENYYKTYINLDIARLFPKLDKVTYQRFIHMLSQLSGTVINKSDVSRNLEVSQPVAGKYMHIAEHTYIWRQLPSFEKNISKSVVKMPKGVMRDSGLRHYLQGIFSVDRLFNHHQVGQSFEAFVIEEIIKGLQATEVKQWYASYYRTRNGAEIDLIIDGHFGQLPIEIKYGVHTPIKQLRSLIDYIKTHQLPFGLVINQADHIAWLTDSVLQLPIGWL